jgi:hypothetical protein
MLAVCGRASLGVVLPTSEAADDFGHREGQLLQSETFTAKAFETTLSRAVAKVLSDCDSPHK